MKKDGIDECVSETQRGQKVKGGFKPRGDEGEGHEMKCKITSIKCEISESNKNNLDN